MRKYYNEKWFEINENLSVQCMTQNTAYGFRHMAILRITSGTGADYRSGTVEDKACYYNRTWETFTYETVLEKVITKAKDRGTIDKKTYLVADKFIKDGGRVADDLKPLKTIAMVAKLGSLFADSQKGANDFKTRVLRVGLQNKGLEIPADWDSLTEDEKTKRLDGAISCLA